MLRQQVGAVLHDHHAGGVELQTGFIILGVEVVGRLAGDVQQGLIGHSTLHREVQHAQRLLVVKELLPVEAVVLLLRHVLLILLPQGDHGVQGLILPDRLILDLAALFLGLYRLTGLHIHHNGVADVVRVLVDQLTQAVLAQILAVLVLLRVRLEGHNDVRTGGLPLAGCDGIAVRALRLPHPGLLGAKLSGDDPHLLGHHKGGVEAHAELADDIDILLLLHGLLEVEGAAVSDGAQILLHLLPAHADTVVRDGEGPGVLIRVQTDLEIAPVQAHGIVRQGLIGQLVDGVGGVGDQLPEEDLPVGVNRIDHQVQQTLGLSFKLHFFHSFNFLLIFGTRSA